MSNDFWNQIKSKYRLGELIHGKIEYHMPFGIFVDIGNQYHLQAGLARKNKEKEKKFYKQVFSLMIFPTIRIYLQSAVNFERPES